MPDPVYDNLTPPKLEEYPVVANTEAVLLPSVRFSVETLREKEEGISDKSTPGRAGRRHPRGTD
jgi:hypothetical protein